MKCLKDYNNYVDSIDAQFKTASRLHRSRLQMLRERFMVWLVLWWCYDLAAVPVGFSHLRFYRWGIDCCRCHFVVVPMMILATKAGIQGTRMFVPNSDDQHDLCACTIQLHQRPISLRQIRAMWWMIVSMLLVRERMAMQRIRCYFRDLKRCPKRWMSPRSHAILMLCESVSSDVKYVSQLRRNHLRTLTSFDRHACHGQRPEMVPRLRHRFQKNQYRRIVMNWLNLVMFCDLFHLVEMPYRDRFCGG